MSESTEAIFNFISKADAHTLITVLQRALCKRCIGSGEIDDAEAGDTSFRTWVCPDCGGKGWNKQALKAIVDAVPEVEEGEDK